MLKIDGSYGEGGGQIVRTALAFSTLTGIPFEMNNIRKGRKQPGLKAQHLHCIKGLEKLCDAKAGYVELGSEKLRFIPGKIKGKTISLDIGTAGSISLLLQALLLPSIFANTKVRLRIKGGTSGKWAMPFDFFNQVFAPHIRKFCEKLDIKLERRGYYPAGGGKVDIKITPKYKLSDFKDFSELKKHILENERDIDLIEQGKLLQIKGVSHASMSLEKAEVADRQAKAAKALLAKFNSPVQIKSEYANTLSDGSGITIWAKFALGEEMDFNNPIILGSDALGERGKRAEQVGKEAAEGLIKEIESYAAVDSHTADNLIPFLVFGGKIKTSRITNHTKTNIWICEQFLGKIFKIDEKENIISV
jgi:RNA 3'-terminal phosphate cyclase (GTP)